MSIGAISNKIVIGDDDNPILEFDNVHINSVESQTAVSIIGEELFVDQFLPVVDYEVWVPHVLRAVPEASDSLSGYMVSFEGFGLDVSSMIVNIEPQQYGNPNPSNEVPIDGWDQVKIRRSGVNLLDTSKFSNGTTAGVTYTRNEDGSISAFGTSTASSYGKPIPDALEASLPAGTYIVSGGTSNIKIHVVVGFHRPGHSWGLSSVTVGDVPQTITVPENANYISVNIGYAPEGTTINDTIYPSITFSTSEYEPYEGDTITIDLGQTVYGGRLDVINGKVYTRPYYENYNGEKLIGPWVSSMDAYALGTTPTIGAQVIDMGGAETEFSITPTQIATLQGHNNIWSNTGSISDFTYLLTENEHRILRSSDGKILTSRRNYDLRQLPYGTRIMYYSDGKAAGEFFSKKVERIGMRDYKITALSAIGLMDKQIHKGGIYRGALFSDVAQEIMGSEYDGTYTIDGVVATQRVYGWLPYSTKRQNLYQLIMAYGVTIRRNENGIMNFVFLENEDPTEIPSSRVFGGGSVTYDDPASRIEVTEHSYHYVSEVDEEVLFDNTADEAAENALITFDNPIYVDSIRVEDTDSITIHQVGVNYAYISGTGIIYGKPYTHNSKILSIDNENAQKEKVVRVEEATLVTLQNSANVLERLAQYYFHAITVKQDIEVEDEKVGNRYKMQNAFYENLEGFIARMDTRTTSFRRASCKIIQNYIPIGHGSSYENSLVIPLDTDAEQTWTVPQSVKEKEVPTVRVVLIGWGYDGEDGEDGGNSTQSTSKAAIGGVGGEGGKGGDGGKVLIVNLDVSEINQLTFYNSNKDSRLVAGNLTYSSGDGASMRYGYYDPFEDKSYAIRGVDGVRGGDGGFGDFWTHAQADQPHSDAVTRGQSVTHNGITYFGGGYSDRRMFTGQEAQQAGANMFSIAINVYVAASSGGGAAVGANGGNAPAKTVSNFSQSTKGGTGADASDADPTAEIYGAGGNGGHGGGGGGTGSMQDWYNEVYKSSNAIYPGPSISGGKGSKGSKGNYGCAIIYY